MGLCRPGAALPHALTAHSLKLAGVHACRSGPSAPTESSDSRHPYEACGVCAGRAAARAATELRPVRCCAAHDSDVAAPQRPGHPGWSIWAMDSETFVGETRGQVGRIHIVVPMPRTSHTHSAVLPQSARPLAGHLHPLRVGSRVQGIIFKPPKQQHGAWVPPCAAGWRPLLSVSAPASAWHVAHGCRARDVMCGPALGPCWDDISVIQCRADSAGCLHAQTSSTRRCRRACRCPSACTTRQPPCRPRCGARHWPACTACRLACRPAHIACHHTHAVLLGPACSGREATCRVRQMHMPTAAPPRELQPGRARSFAFPVVAAQPASPVQAGTFPHDAPEPSTRTP